MSGDWIHTRRGSALVDGTLPRIARALEQIAVVLRSEEQKIIFSLSANDLESALEEGWLVLSIDWDNDRAILRRIKD